jgi:protein involved in polysaccharide export with SLBB domain
MFKPLFFVSAFLLCSFCVNAQSSTNYTDSLRGTAPERVVSPEARSEAKRLYKDGVKYGLAGLYSQAAQIFELAVKLDPHNADAHFALGHAYFDLKQWKKAVWSFERAVELNPKDQETIDFLSLARTMAHGGAEPPKSRPQTQAEPVVLQVAVNAKPAPPSEKTETSPDETNEVKEVDAAAKETALTKIYRVGPGDVLDIRINDSASPQSTLFTVTPSGFLEHPMLAEPLQARGLTTDEISAKFEEDLKRRALVENPKVFVGVRDYASHTILVSGLVKDSGTKILRREAIPLYVVVADAQPLPEAARVTVLRNESSETFDVDLSETAELSLLVRPGDVITLLPNETQFIYVGGEVKQPGEKTYRRNLTLTQAIIAAGGVTPRSKEARLGRDDGKGFLVVTRYK